MNELRKVQEPVPSSFNYINNKEKLAWLMAEYGDVLVRLAFTYVRCRETAEDIVQEVFIKCYQKLDDFRGESSYKSWLYRITINTCKDYLKSWTFRNVKISNYITSLVKSQKSSETEYLIQEENYFISQCVISLPLKYREIIIFYYYEGLSINEISVLLNINQNTVKSRLLRGRDAVRKLLKEGGFNG